MKVSTWSGSIYEFRDGMVRRGEYTHAKRGDGKWLKLLVEPAAPVVGESMRLVLEPLNPQSTETVRVTSEVIGIEE